jgi:serine-type D-Ala-D-Ala carboxypeptidase
MKEFHSHSRSAMYTFLLRTQLKRLRSIGSTLSVLTRQARRGPGGPYWRGVAYVTVAVSLSACTAGQTADTRFESLDESVSGDRSTAFAIVQKNVDDGLVAGAVLRVSRNGVVEEQAAFGYAQLFEYQQTRLADPVPTTTEHVFDLASLTKVFATTFAIMLLVDSGSVGLDKPLRTYLPEFRGPSRDSISVRQLLSHTSGLPPWKPTYFHARTGSEAFDYICSLPLEYAVGTNRHYSDLGFMLLGYLVEQISGQGLDEFLRVNLYKPLGLHHTGFQPLKHDFGPLVATSQGNPFERRMVEDPDFGYFIQEDPSEFTEWRTYTLLGEVNDGNSWYAHGGVAGHAGLFSTAADLDVLVTLLMDGGLYNGAQLIKAETISEFLTPGATGNGLGWAMSTDVLPVSEMPPGAFGHTGFTGTYVFVNPGERVSVILLTNRQNGGVDDAGNYPSLSPIRREVTRAIMTSNKQAAN